MLKLLKYEFRKALNAFLALLGITAALEIYFLAALSTKNENHLVISSLLLMFSAYASAIFVFVRGITSYSGELRSRASYLIFLTPNSTVKILASKYLYTFVNGLLFLCLFGYLTYLDFGLLATKYYSYTGFYSGIKALLRSNGVYLDQILGGGLFMIAFTFIKLLSTIGVAYFAITLSHTLLHDKKWRWLPALVMFCALSWGVNYICSLFPSAVDQLVMIDMTGTQVVPDNQSLSSILVPALLPTLGVSVAVIAASLFGSAHLLKKSVSL